MQRPDKSTFAVAFVSRYHAGCAWRKSLRADRPAQADAVTIGRPTLTLLGPRREAHATASIRAVR